MCPRFENVIAAIGACREGAPVPLSARVLY
jgi:hypothetical protein